MPLTPEALRSRLAGQSWTSHNIRLTPEISTMPGEPDFIETDLRLHAIVRVLRFLHGDRFDGLRIADLGCLEGGFALGLAQLGAHVVGVEARSINIEKTRLLQEHFGLDRLEFVCADVKDFSVATFGMFDVVLALGILYHLDQPSAWLEQIAEATKRILVVDTHYAPSQDEGLGKLDANLPLGPIETVRHARHTYEGRWFHEYGEEIDPEDQLWASYSNNRSFWLTKESLLMSIRNSGFDLVFEQHDYSAPFYRRFTTSFPRVMIVAAKSQPASA